MRTSLGKSIPAIVAAALVITLSACTTPAQSSSANESSNSQAEVTTPTPESQESSGSTDSTKSSEPAGTVEPVTKTPTTNTNPENTKLLTFKGATVAGENFDSSLLIKKPTVLWFWTPWCSVCFSEGPVMAKLKDQYGDKINFLGIAAQGTRAEMQEFITKAKPSNFTHLNDESGTLWRRFGVTSQPTLLLVSSDHSIKRHVGYITTSELEKEIKKFADSAK